jgi:uncharacterized protein YebE (UPF0316 family)
MPGIESLLTPEIIAWVGLPLLIFVARVIDVSLGTLRIIFTSRGKRYLAPLLGFVEVFIWVSVISQITRAAQGLPAYLAYAAGFAAGNYAGMLIEDRLALGTVILRIILASGAETLAQDLYSAGYGVTRVDGQGANGPVKLIYTIVKRKDLPVVLGIIHQVAPKVFLSIEEVRSTEQGIFPSGRGGALSIRKSK